MFGYDRTGEYTPRGGKYRAYLNQINGIEPVENRAPSHAKETFFGLRFMIAIVLFSAYLFFGGEYKQEILRHITPDYSKNVFDFITELAYTLDYETTSVK